MNECFHICHSFLFAEKGWIEITIRKEREAIMLKRPQVGIGVLITKDDQVLLMKRKSAHGDGTWSTAGGHLKYRESPEECAIRETQEELGVLMTEVTFLAITNDVFDTPEKHYVTIWLAGRYVSGTPTINAAHEMSELSWFSWNALPDPLFLPFEHLLSGQCYPTLWELSASDQR